MRLIDADAWIDALNEVVFDENMPKAAKVWAVGMIARITERETAYDVEAVVAELEKTKNECEPIYGGRICGKEAKAICAMALSYAISIVRGKE